MGRALARSAALLVWIGVLATAVPCLAQHASGLRPIPPSDTPENEKKGRELVADLLSRAPVESTNTGVVRVRGSDGTRTQTPFKYEIFSTPTNWVSLYRTLPSPGGPKPVRLAIIHTGQQPNRYFLGAPGGALDSGKALKGSEIMAPFAGSDFSVADLGLQFLHWPKQLLVKTEMRRGQSCYVLESVKPSPTPGGYSRVVSWIDIDSGGILHADAYDERGNLLKQFDPTELQKVEGERQLKEMEMRNRQTGSHSWIDFNLTSQ